MSQGTVGCKNLVVLVEPLHPVGHPAAACFHKSEFEARKAFQQAAGNHAERRDHLFEGMGHGVGVKGMIETLRRGRHAIAGADVNANRDVEPLRFGKERKKIGIVEILFRCRDRWRRDRDKFQIFHGAPELLHRFDRILDGDCGHAL